MSINSVVVKLRYIIIIEYYEKIKVNNEELYILLFDYFQCILLNRKGKWSDRWIS